jgi:hypothetical protein
MKNTFFVITMPSLPRQEDYRRLLDAVRSGDLNETERILTETDPWLGYFGGGAGTVPEAILRATGNREEIIRLLVTYGLNIPKKGLDGPAMKTVREVLAAGPRWRLEAFEREIEVIYIVRSKAWGIYFVPGDGQCPILYGGNYDGEYPVTAQAALTMLDRDLLDSRLGNIASHAAWFRPFLVKMVNGADFQLRDLLALIPDERSIVYR